MQTDVFKNDVLSGKAFMVTDGCGGRGRQITAGPTIAIDGGQYLSESPSTQQSRKRSGAERRRGREGQADE